MQDEPFRPSALEFHEFLAAFDLTRVDIQDFLIHRENDTIILDITLNQKKHACPRCNVLTDKVKGYQQKQINHSILNPLGCTINYRSRRYVCTNCGKTFPEANPFVFPGLKISVATVYNVLQELKTPQNTFSQVAEKYNMSASSVSNIFDRHIQIARRSLPECLCFDETYAFKSRDSDYVCVLLDYNTKNIVDLLPSRRKAHLMEYFYKIPLEERKQVKYVSFDMWYTYRDVSKAMFPNCVCIVDKFHVLQEISRKVTRIRVRVMNQQKKIIDELKEKRKKLLEEKHNLSADEEQVLRSAQSYYYLLKKFNWVLFSNDKVIENPKAEGKYNHYFQTTLNLYEIKSIIMNMDITLQKAVNLKDMIHFFYKKTKYEEAKSELEYIIIKCRESEIVEFEELSTMLKNWKQEIINSFIQIPSLDQRRMNNALIENRNKAIKLIKHSSNGYTNWERFRKRVLYCLNDQTPMKQ